MDAVQTTVFLTEPPQSRIKNQKKRKRRNNVSPPQNSDSNITEMEPIRAIEYSIKASDATGTIEYPGKIQSHDSTSNTTGRGSLNVNRSRGVK
ncbi:hypothetical protein CHS0354_012611 [Potamilus streckersoni]|uniref:Uncharacterized protein n=1 Tax=Potamilus streckersoni TaxID=2493646 RepID=A0AAE0SYI8_9BIVA|nr:hypothetical protein CHS0354_012611 [Potamilus streckersoni]